MSAFGTAADTCLSCGHVGYCPTGVCADESACVARWEAAQRPARVVLCEARCESGKGAGTCPTCGTVYR